MCKLKCWVKGIKHVGIQHQLFFYHEQEHFGKHLLPYGKPTLHVQSHVNFLKDHGNYHCWNVTFRELALNCSVSCFNWVVAFSISRISILSLCCVLIDSICSSCSSFKNWILISNSTLFCSRAWFCRASIWIFALDAFVYEGVGEGDLEPLSPGAAFA